MFSLLKDVFLLSTLKKRCSVEKERLLDFYAAAFICATYLPLPPLPPLLILGDSRLKHSI